MSKTRKTKLASVKEEDSEEFVKEFNSNKVSDEFLDSCRKVGKMFGNKEKEGSKDV